MFSPTRLVQPEVLPLGRQRLLHTPKTITNSMGPGRWGSVIRRQTVSRGRLERASRTTTHGWRTAHGGVFHVTSSNEARATPPGWTPHRHEKRGGSLCGMRHAHWYKHHPRPHRHLHQQRHKVASAGAVTRFRAASALAHHPPPHVVPRAPW
jgi:hypothetical protein